MSPAVWAKPTLHNDYGFWTSPHHVVGPTTYTVRNSINQIVCTVTTSATTSTMTNPWPQYTTWTILGGGGGAYTTGGGGFSYGTFSFEFRVAR